MTIEQDQERYVNAMHAVQSGVASKMEFAPSETTPKSLRVGVNAAMVETATLQRLLVEKGVITWEEWWAALADQAEAEKAAYEDELNDHFRVEGRISLG
jgi:hypothetical protein